MVRLEANFRQQRADAQQQPQRRPRVARVNHPVCWPDGPPATAAHAQRPCAVAVPLPARHRPQRPHRPHEHRRIIAKRRRVDDTLTRSEQRVEQIAQRVILRSRQARRASRSLTRAQPAHEDALRWA